MEGNIGFGKCYKRDAVVEIADEEELINSLKDNVCISIANDFTISKRIKIKNSITISGNGNVITMEESGSLYFQDTKDIFVENITINGCGSDWDNNLDLLTFDNVQNIVVNNCTFRDGADECVCLKNGCDNITISNTTFAYTRKPITLRNGKDHNFALLIGKNPEDKPISGKHHVTLYRVTFLGPVRRCPRVRNGLVHLIECEFNNNHIYSVGPENSELVFINCIYFGEPDGYKRENFIRKFGDYKCIVINKGETLYKNPKFSEFNLPEYYKINI